MNIFSQLLPRIDLDKICGSIQKPSDELSQKARSLLREQFGDAEEELGRLAPLVLRWLDISGKLYPQAPKKSVIICCADHGVAEEGVSAYPQQTTLEMAKNYMLRNGAAANAFSAYAGASLLVADLGIAADTADIPDLFPLRIAAGTKNMTKGPAMTREQASASIKTGILLAHFLIDNGCDWILPGEMGIANTTASAAIAAVCCGKTPEEVTGRGTNISDTRLKKKIEVVRRALAVNQPNPNDALDILAKVGGFEFGCMAGLILGAASAKKAVILDGANCAAAALLAQKLAPESISYVFASHLGSEASHHYMLQQLGLQPFLHLDLRLSEAAGSAIAARIMEDFLAYWYTTQEKVPADIGWYDFCKILQQGEYCVLNLKEYAHYYDDKDDDLINAFTMSEQNIKLTDTTFDFYLDSMPDLDKNAMAVCRHRIDHLTKPIDSLGCLEQIACAIAGTSGIERPGKDTQRVLQIFSLREKLSPSLSLLLKSCGASAGFQIYFEQVNTEKSPAAAFDFGREEGEVAAALHPLLALGVDEASTEDAPGTMAAALRQTLLTADGELRYPADTFLKYVPEKYQHLVSALLGAIIAGAHNHGLILLDSDALKIIARYALQIAPEIRSYLLPVQPELVDLNLRLPGLTAACGMQIVLASLFMLNNMKTFEETKVSIATSGPGSVRQNQQHDKADTIQKQ
ncbi:nicotinate-nucleotide--dimethylbenzimidazole phosphoribosyltransferase [Mitsuokella sp. WILCCON 0060]|uniref:nicotinate-nucleotide--dimethylbenzimidazole phosphoribosyltransferase n=1 Tax=Mitsuokella sp. WILCCON 0060 TaxID=3345341 RepID=UPI003F1B6596